VISASTHVDGPCLTLLFSPTLVTKMQWLRMHFSNYVVIWIGSIHMLTLLVFPCTETKKSIRIRVHTCSCRYVHLR